MPISDERAAELAERLMLDAVRSLTEMCVLEIMEDEGGDDTVSKSFTIISPTQERMTITIAIQLEDVPA